MEHKPTHNRASPQSGRPAQTRGRLRRSARVRLVSGACFSEFGWQVTCVDKDRARLAEELGRQGLR